MITSQDLEKAVGEGKKKVVDFLVDHDVPVTPESIKIAHENGHYKMASRLALQYIEKMAAAPIPKPVPKPEPIAAQNIVMFKTCEVVAFKQMVQLLAKRVDTLYSTTFSPAGIHIFKLNSDKDVLINIKLDPAGFVEFKCFETRTVGINMLELLNDILNNIDDDKTLEIIVQQNYKMKVISFNEHERQEFTCDVSEAVDPRLPIPDKCFDYEISMPPASLNNICKKALIVSSFMKIKIKDKCASFTSDNLFADDKDGNKYKNVFAFENDKSNQKVFCETYTCRNILSFSRCGKLCSEIKLSFLEDYPLVMEIPIATLGTMRIFITQIEKSK